MYFIITDKNDMITVIIKKDFRLTYKLKHKCSTGLNKFSKLKCSRLVENYNIYCTQSCYLRVAISLQTEIPSNHISSNEYLINGNIILSERYCLYDPATIIKFELEPTMFITNACYFGSVNFLQWLKDYDAPSLYYEEEPLDIATCHNHLNVLTWWINSGLPLKYSKLGLDFASKNGYVEALEWWKNSGLELKYSNASIDMASSTGKLKVLEWWFKSGLELKYTEKALDKTSMNGSVDVLEWWFKSGLELKYTEKALDKASMNGRVDVLELWFKSGLELKYTTNAVSNALGKCDINVLEWWAKSGLKLKYDEHSFSRIPKNKLKLMLEWCDSKGLDFPIKIYDLYPCNPNVLILEF
jgi:hypothetical protein